MRKKIAVLLSVIILIGVFSVFAGCAGVKQEAEFGENLVEAVSHEKDSDVYNVKLKTTTVPNTMVLKEKKDLVTLFRVYAKVGDSWVLIYEQDRIGNYRVCVIDPIETDELKIEIKDKKGKTKIDEVAVYKVSNKTKNMRVTEYLRMDEDIIGRKDDIGFTGYFDVVTDLILFTGKSINEYGNLIFDEGEAEFNEELAVLREIKPDMRFIGEINIKLKDNSTTADNLKNNRDKIVETIYYFVKKYNLHGVDFDWEYPENSSQWKEYSNFINALHAKLSPEGKTISIAIAPWGCGLTKKAISNIDYFNLMTYDLFDDRNEHASFVNTTRKSVWEITSRTSIKKEQIQLGLSIYGRTTDKSGYAWPDMKWDYYENNGSLGKWGNYIYNFEYTENGVKKQCDAYMTGYAANRDKTHYALNAGLGGIMLFRMLCDAPYTYEYSVHRAVYDALNL